jgi:hypothetical protein
MSLGEIGWGGKLGCRMAHFIPVPVSAYSKSGFWLGLSRMDVTVNVTGGSPAECSESLDLYRNVLSRFSSENRMRKR